MAKNLAPNSRKWRKKIQIGENGGERKINPSANPDIIMSSLCSVEVTSNLDQVISDAGYEVMLDNVSINLTVMLSLCSVEVTSNLDQVISDAGYEVMLDNVSINLADTRERSGSVVEYLTRDRRAPGSSLTGVTALCPWARHIS